MLLSWFSLPQLGTLWWGNRKVEGAGEEVVILNVKMYSTPALVSRFGIVCG